MKGKVAMIALLMASLALAGCTDGDGAAMDGDTLSGDTVTNGADTVLTFGPHSGLPTERGENWTASLDEPPQWTLGEWWDIEMTDLLITGETQSVTRIAAGKEANDLLVGMPIDEFSDNAMIFHIPGFGLVHSDTLGFEMHDFLFDPLHFPLTEGDSWDTLWEGFGVNVQVLETDDDEGTALLQMTGFQPAEFTYDANLGVIRDFVAPGYLEFHVTDHGFDHEGLVRVPYSHDMTMFNGRLGPVSPVQLSEGAIQQTSGSCLPTLLVNGCAADFSAPMETFTIPESGPNGVTYDRASFALIIAEVAPLLAGGETQDPAYDLAGNGYYQIDLTAPNGETYSLSKAPTEARHKISSHYNDAPAGDWELTVIGAGPAQVFVEGITYTTFDVDLPNGCVVLDVEIHDHGGPCGGHVHNLE